jgi:hypothetical protein
MAANKKPRRKRSDSAEAAAEIMQHALTGQAPPACVILTEKEQPFWDVIIAARADWTAVDLVHAAAMARCLCAMEYESRLLAAEGVIITKEKSTTLNPRVAGLKHLARLSLDYSVKIQVHANATIGTVDEQLNRNKQKKQALDALANNAEDLEDGLIARPKH